MVQNKLKGICEKTAVIFIGIQGSGKTYLYRHLFAEDHVHINLDELRTRNREKLLLEECIAAGRSFVVDNTNPTRADRQRYIPLAKSAGYRVVGCFLQSRLQDCIARNEQRTGKAHIPPNAIAATSNRLEMPDLEEGFDELYFVSYENGEINISEWRKAK